MHKTLRKTEKTHSSASCINYFIFPCSIPARTLQVQKCYLERRLNNVIRAPLDLDCVWIRVRENCKPAAVLRGNGQSNVTHQDTGLLWQDLLGHQAPIAGNVHLVHAPVVIKTNYWLRKAILSFWWWWLVSKAMFTWPLSTKCEALG